MNDKYKFSLIGVVTVIANIVFLTSVIIFDVNFGLVCRPIVYTIIGLIILLTTLSSFRKSTFGCGFLIATMFAAAFSICLVLRTDNDKYFNRGVEYYNNGEYEKALVEFMLVKNYGPTEEYLETVTIVRLKGTDEEMVVEKE